MNKPLTPAMLDILKELHNLETAAERIVQRIGALRVTLNQAAQDGKL